ncbi:hypothetical protein cypCar_00021520 [Cyprinus carpio]|nr:hypothetical protein cypCar_00021520 [Cyprinus carpio]
MSQKFALCKARQMAAGEAGPLLCGAEGSESAEQRGRFSTARCVNDASGTKGIVQMVMLKKGDHFWIDSSIGVPIGGYVKVSASGQYCLIDDEGKVKAMAHEDLYIRRDRC